MEVVFVERRVVFDLALGEFKARRAFLLNFEFHVHRPEGQIAVEHREEDNAQSPHIDRTIVGLLGKYLGGHVGGCPAVCVGVFFDLPRKAHIAYFGCNVVAFVGAQNIFELDVSMEDIPAVHV